jgi:chromate transport protein ChrA
MVVEQKKWMDDASFRDGVTTLTGGYKSNRSM